MADKTLNDVIQRMREEGQLDRNSGTHSIKSVKELIAQQGEDTRKTIQELKAIFGGVMPEEGDDDSPEKEERSPVGEGANNLTAGDLQQDEREEDKYQGGVLGLLQIIADNTAGMGGSKKEPEKKDEKLDLKDIGVGALIAGSLAAIPAGIALGQLKAIEALIPGIKTMRVNIQKGFIRLGNFFTEDIPQFIKNTGQRIRNGFRAVETVVTDGIRAIEEFFRPAGKIVKGIGTGVALAVAPIKNSLLIFEDGFKAVAEVMEFFGKVFKGNVKLPKMGIIDEALDLLRNLFRGLGTVFKTVATTVGRIFAPIAIVMTVFDTATAAMKGYEEEGIIGFFKGAIKGFIGSLITAPLDLLKDGIAWIMEKFGVDPGTVDAVRSFSFTEILNNLVDAPIQTLKKAANFVLEKVAGFFGMTGEEAGNDPSELISRIYAAPFELLQKGIAKMLSFFGAEDAAAEVENFDIKGAVKNVIKPITDLVMSVIGFYTDIFKKGIDLAGGLISGDYSISDVFKEILRSILPDPSKEREWYDPIGLVQRAIPDSVYEYAGIDPETGEVLEQLPVRTPEVEVPDMEVAPALNTEELEEGVAAAQNATRIEIPVETRAPVVGAAVETDDVRVERSDVTGREAQQLALQQQQQDLANQQAAQSSTAMVLNSPTSVQTNNNVSNSNTTVGITGTSGDPLDKSWGGI